MSKSVTVPARLLMDIFRLLEYLAVLGNHDELHFHKAGYSYRYEQDNALWELKVKINQLQGQIAETYLLTVDGVTEDEEIALREWIASGNGIFDNPHLLCDESGCPMDFINGCRMGIDMSENPSEFGECRPDAANGGRDSDWGIPF